MVMGSTRTYTFEEALRTAYQAAINREPSRETSLVVTKLEEAILWHDRYREITGLGPMGLEWYKR
jgi:hypothetical protein